MSEGLREPQPPSPAVLAAGGVHLRINSYVVTTELLFTVLKLPWAVGGARQEGGQPAGHAAGTGWGRAVPSAAARPVSCGASGGQVTPGWARGPGRCSLLSGRQQGLRGRAEGMGGRGPSLGVSAPGRGGRVPTGGAACPPACLRDPRRGRAGGGPAEHGERGTTAAREPLQPQPACPAAQELPRSWRRALRCARGGHLLHLGGALRFLWAWLLLPQGVAPACLLALSPSPSLPPHHLVLGRCPTPGTPGPSHAG